MPVDELNRATLRMVDYARAISPNVTALHITDDIERGQELRARVGAAVLDVPLVLIDSPYRSFVAPVQSYIDALDRTDPGQYVTVVLPEFRTRGRGSGSCTTSRRGGCATRCWTGRTR